MSSTPYNGYSWAQRSRILMAEGRKRAQRPCDMCGDPECPGGRAHSEDYSEPYLFAPPATFAICNVCHSRLHKRFAEPSEKWHLFLEHLRSGGYGREFTKMYSKAQRERWSSDLKSGRRVALPKLRSRGLKGSEWWQHLTLDPESLVAAWARPRPLRPRPSTKAYEAALAKIKPASQELGLLRFHACCPNRSATMRQIARGALSSKSPSRANVAYGRFAHRLGEALGWEPDRRRDKSPIWMSVVAEGWQPKGREYEWVLIPVLTEMFAPT